MFNKKVLKVIVLIIFVIVVVLLCCIFIPNSIIYGIPIGYVDKYEKYQEDGFQDYRDYAEYKYTNLTKNLIIRNKKYKKVTTNDFENIDGYFKNLGYYFRDTISEGDYVRIETKEGQGNKSFAYGKYDCYSIYYFDIETLTLFYISTTY